MVRKENINITHKTYWNTCMMSNYAVCCNYFTGKDVDTYFDDYFLEFEKDFANPLSFFGAKSKNNSLHSEFATHYNSQFKDFIKDYKEYLSGRIDISIIMEEYGSVFTYHFHLRTQPNYIPYKKDQSKEEGGYQFLKLLHDNIDQPNFKESREKVNVFFIERIQTGGCFRQNDLGFLDSDELVEYVRNEEVLINAYDSNHSHSLTIYCDLNTKSFFVHNTNEPNDDKLLPDYWVNSYDNFLIYKLNNYTDS